MRLLFIAPYTPTLLRTRSYNLVRALAQRGHAVTLAAPWDTAVELEAQQALKALGIEVLTAPLTRPRAAANALGAFFAGLPLQARFCWQPELAAQIPRRLEQPGPRFDAIHVEHLRGAEYGRWAQGQAARAGHGPVVWDSVDCISLLFEQTARHSRARANRWIARLELPRTRRYEGQMVGLFSGVVATSARDAAALDALGQARPQSRPISPVRVLPNGVDSDYFSPAAATRSGAQVVLSGKMSYHSNVTAALHLVDKIMPIVWGQRPDVTVVIAGSAPTRQVRQLAERHAPRVQVLGHVPDIRPHLQAAGVAAAPITYGAGIQNKVLEAMACGVPVVASPQASSALEAKAGSELAVASEPNAFAQALLRLLNDAALRQAMGMAGRRYVVANHQWNRIVGILEGYYDEFAGPTSEHTDRNRPRQAI